MNKDNIKTYVDIEWIEGPPVLFVPSAILSMEIDGVTFWRKGDSPITSAAHLQAVIKNGY